jgi:hypothetical protein
MPDTNLLPWYIGGGNLAGQETGRQHLSHTALSAFLACPQKYAFHYEQGLRPRATPAPFTLGRAFQLAVELNDPVAGAASLREGASPSSQAAEDRTRVNEAIVAAASTLYLQRYGTVSRGIESVKEFEYRVRLRNPRTGYPSRSFDLLGYADEYIDFGGMRAGLVENKLVGQITEMSVRKLPLDRQVALACYGIWRATGQEVNEVFYRFTRKPSIKQRQGETVDEFCDRLTADYAERPDFYVHEEHFYRSADDLLRVETELWEWASQIRRQRAGDFACRNTSHCTDFGGCAYVPMCLGEQGAEGLYETRTSVQTDATSDPEQTKSAA